MKTLAVLVLLAFFSEASYGQLRCGTSIYHNGILDTYPVLKGRAENFEKGILEGLYELNGTITIPVVVHVVYKKNEEYVQRVFVESLINTLNLDFAGRNPDISRIPQPFRSSQAGDCGIRFSLDTILYRKTNVDAFTVDLNKVAFLPAQDAIKFSEQGGSSTRSPTSRLNLWIGNILHRDSFGDTDDLYGYATFPGTESRFDGVVINYRHVIGIGSKTSYNRGRTATHEVGHFLGLKHLWGNGSDNVCGDDGLSDTPPQMGATLECPPFPKTSCDNIPQGGMFMNYMDYVYDDCKFMFTSKQRALMRNTLNTLRTGIISGSTINKLFRFEKSQRTHANVPPLIDSVSNLGDTVVLNWHAWGADSYIVHYRDLTNDSWAQIKTDDSSLKLPNLPKGRFIEFRVSAVFGRDILSSDLFLFYHSGTLP